MVMSPIAVFIFSLTGWKMGWAYGPEHLIRNLHIAHQNCVYACPTPLQEALAVSLEKEVPLLNTPDSFFIKMALDLKERRDLMAKAVKETGMTPVVPEGGYFMMVNWKALGKRPNAIENIM